MGRLTFPLVLLTFVGSVFLASFLPSHVQAETKVHRKAVQHEVELYVTSWWPYCNQAKSFLASKGIEFKVYDIEKDAAAAQRKKQLDVGRGVPFAVINGIKISGWSQRAYEAALEQWK